ncbi:MAG: hypothetical protein A2355_15755 [Spirochaetes bacterium RIFOXYB1_FULL_32_8]|nr:MAG: hypothetical protein A2355_15755 [Spirochaetes bacterium RIFOXYB1_FULL_32_8]
MLITKEVLDVSLDDNEVKEILDDHGCRIIKLEIDTATTKEKMFGLEEQVKDIKGTLVRFENNYLQTTSSMTNLMTQLVLNTSNNNTEIIKSKDIKDTEITKSENAKNTEVIKTKDNNKKDIIIKVLAILGACIAGYLANKYGIKISM